MSENYYDPDVDAAPVEPETGVPTQGAELAEIKDSFLIELIRGDENAD